MWKLNLLYGGLLENEEINVVNNRHSSYNCFYTNLDLLARSSMVEHLALNQKISRFESWRASQSYTLNGIKIVTRKQNEEKERRIYI